MKKGLVMEGGAMRGLFTAGVTDVMMENGIEFDGAIGVSAGAAFGCNFKSGQIGRVLRYNVNYCRDKRYCSLRSLIKTGNLYGAEFCYHELPDKLDIFDVDAFNNSKMEFYAVCTDVETGGAVYKKCEKADYDCLEWIRASASMPLVSKIVEIDGYKLLDGGFADSVPLKYFEGIGYDKNVVILTQPKDYIKKKNSLMPIMKIAFGKYPEFIKTIETRHIMYNETLEYIAEKEKNGEILAIRPKTALGVGKTEKNPEKLKATYELGREEAARRLEDIKNFLK